MFDTIIRGGTIYDGSGDKPFRGDVGIKDGLIAEIGTITQSAREEIDADGAIVTPGFIDLHTHYDGQFLWDDKIDPSFSHGITTAIAGNCGVGFAPVAEHRQELIHLMEGVEDIPEIVLDEGLDWSWSSFPEYLDKLDARSYSMDIASHITHAPLRVFVMKERALRHERATEEDIRKMSDLVREAMAAGAVGFSNGRLLEHFTSRGEHVPGTFAEDDELLALASAMGEGGFGVFQHIPKGTVGDAMQMGIERDERVAEHDRIVALARAANRPLTYTLAQFDSDPGDYKVMLDNTHRAAAQGLDIRPQIAARSQGMVHTLDGYHVFVRRPSYAEIAHLDRAGRAAAMRDPARRARILAEEDSMPAPNDKAGVAELLDHLAINLPNTFITRNMIDIEPGPERTLRALAEAADKTAEEYLYDHYAEGDGENFSISILLNYATGDLEHVFKVLSDPHVVCGLGDGGAHMRFICDATMPTLLLAYWSRDRTLGDRIPVELAVRKLSGEPAELYGLNDRGRLAVGRRADVNVIDYQNLGLTRPGVDFDLPSGAGRLLQGSQGYLATLVNGVVTRRFDEDTGARPGRLIRAGRAH